MFHRVIVVVSALEIRLQSTEIVLKRERDKKKRAHTLLEHSSDWIASTVLCMSVHCTINHSFVYILNLKIISQTHWLLRLFNQLWRCCEFLTKCRSFFFFQKKNTLKKIMSDYASNWEKEMENDSANEKKTKSF